MSDRERRRPARDPTPPARAIRELAPTETHLAFPAIASLRDLTDEAWFVERVNRDQRPAGYRLLGAFEDDQAAAVAVIGFRLVRNLALGDYLYIDDLVTLPAARRRGHARALLEFVVSEAEQLNLREVYTDLDDVSPPWELRRTWKRSYGGFGRRIPPPSWFTPRMLFTRFGFEEVRDHNPDESSGRRG